jgi:cell filamentation protein
MCDDIYCYPNGTLRNKFGITDFNELQTLERDFTSTRITDLRERPIAGEFNLQHLQDIHKHIFGDIYDWAGNIRRVGIAKPSVTGFIKRPAEFCPEWQIPKQAYKIFNLLSKDNYLRELEKSDFTEGLSVYMSSVNNLHPFREGNGRTQRLFFEQLSHEVGYDLDFSKTNKNSLLKADDLARKGNCKPLQKILNGIVIQQQAQIPQKSNADFANRFAKTTISTSNNNKSDESSDFNVNK